MPVHEIIDHRGALIETLDAGTFVRINPLVPLMLHGFPSAGPHPLDLSMIGNRIVRSNFPQQACPEIAFSLTHKCTLPRLTVGVELPLLLDHCLFLAQAASVHFSPQDTKTIR